jgi:hypothetical protein
MEANVRHIEKAKNDLEQLERDLSIWRRKNKGKRIPPDLWDEAVRLSRLLGIGRVARIARLFYPNLKERVTKAGAMGTKGARQTSKMSFVEVPLPPLSEAGVSNQERSRLFFQLKTRLGTWKVEWV